MQIHNLVEYSPNYSETRGSLWFYSKGEGTNYFESFEYKTKLLGNTVAQDTLN